MDILTYTFFRYSVHSLVRTSIKNSTSVWMHGLLCKPVLSRLAIRLTDILQYRLRFGFSLQYKTVFHLNSLTAQLSYEGRAAVEGAK
jgi:hypothetical protein